MLRIGIMGGTFDPIHFGHLVTAEAARHAFKLDQVIFVPSGRPPHKRVRRVSADDHRYLMTVLATVTNPWFEVSRVELDRPGPSYAIDTVVHFRDRYPGTEIFFITGADAILEIVSWERRTELFDLCHFIAATRPGYPMQELESLRSALEAEEFERINPLEVPALAISSSDIRVRLNKGEPVKYLLPESVERYILKNSLYLG